MRRFGLLESRRRLLPHTSLWGLWSGVAEANGLAAQEVAFVARHLGESCVSPWAARDARLPQDAYQRGVQDLFGVDATVAAQATGIDLAQGGVRHRAWFYSTLSFCPACMADGYHSLVFQHRALLQCPIHATALRHRCQGCGSAIAASFSAAAAAPFACPACGRSLATTLRAQPASPLVIEQRMRAARVGLTLQLVPADGDRGSLALVPGRSHEAGDRVLARRAARFASWHDHDPYVARAVARRSRRLALEEHNASADRLCIGQHIGYLRWLARLEKASPEHYAASTPILQRLQWNPTDPALPTPVSVVAAALARLRLLYGGIPEEQLGARLAMIEAEHASRIRVLNPPPFVQRGIACAVCVAGNQALLDSELDALATWLVLHTQSAARKYPASRLPWNAQPDATQIAPAWRVSRDGDCAELHFRPAVMAGTLPRMIQRAAGHFVRPG